LPKTQDNLELLVHQGTHNYQGLLEIVSQENYYKIHKKKTETSQVKEVGKIQIVLIHQGETNCLIT
jgi:hypothetical protein